MTTDRERRKFVDDQVNNFSKNLRDFMHPAADKIEALQKARIHDQALIEAARKRIAELERENEALRNRLEEAHRYWP